VSYIEALAGRLSVVADFGDQSVVVDEPATPSADPRIPRALVTKGKYGRTVTRRGQPDARRSPTSARRPRTRSSHAPHLQPRMGKPRLVLTAPTLRGAHW